MAVPHAFAPAMQVGDRVVYLGRTESGVCLIGGAVLRSGAHCEVAVPGAVCEEAEGTLTTRGGTAFAVTRVRVSQLRKDTISSR